MPLNPLNCTPRRRPRVLFYIVLVLTDDVGSETHAHVVTPRSTERLDVACAMPPTHRTGPRQYIFGLPKGSNCARVNAFLTIDHYVMRNKFLEIWENDVSNLLISLENRTRIAAELYAKLRKCLLHENRARYQNVVAALHWNEPSLEYIQSQYRPVSDWYGISDHKPGNLEKYDEHWISPNRYTAPVRWLVRKLWSAS